MERIRSDEPGLGTGLYTFTEAARILHASPNSIRRWARGYVFRERVCKPPVLQARSASLGLLTFRDLVELRFVKMFRERKVKLTDIVAASERLARELGNPYPFACKRLETDGRQLLEEFGQCFRNPANAQFVFDFVSQFFKDMDFDDEDMAERWYPLGREKQIVIDRHRSYGAPIVGQRGVRTEVVYGIYKAENRDAQLVADWYDISREAVLAAVEFEEEWRKAA